MKLLAALATSIAIAFFAAPSYADHNHGTEDHHKPDIVDTAVKAGKFSTLIAAVKAAGLEEKLRSDGPLTVFAPTDEAFAALPPGTVEELLKPKNKEQLAALMAYHVVEGATLSGDLAGNTLEIASVGGGNIVIDGTDGVKLNNDANVTSADVLTSNGIIHIVDAVLIPPAR